MDLNYLILVLMNILCKKQNFFHIKSIPNLRSKAIKGCLSIFYSVCGCNSTIRDGQRFLYTPNLPHPYDANSNCHQHITAEESPIAFLSFR